VIFRVTASYPWDRTMEEVLSGRAVPTKRAFWDEGMSAAREVTPPSETCHPNVLENLGEA
jgi:hypothetical protein